MNKQAAINSIIDNAIGDFKSKHPSRRHPADVTADRLGDATTKYDFTPQERDAVSIVINALRRFSRSDD